jgi:CYTH domain-containing protein
MTNTGKYSRIENERRFLLKSIDQELTAMGLPKKIILDHYLTGTHLRLREVDTVGEKVFKLTKKTHLLPGKEEITTIYLSSEEYDLLSKLPATIVSKVRLVLTHNEFTIGIDIYTGEKGELLIAETEFETDEQMKSFVLPIPYDKEVTGDANFSGHALAIHFGSESCRR